MSDAGNGSQDGQMSGAKSIQLYDRIYRMAQFQAQIAIAILPIGAGIAGFISQQKYTSPILAAMILVWLGLITLTFSVIFSLKVIRTEPDTLSKREDMETNYGVSIVAFVIGISFLIVSPIGFPLHKLLNPSAVEMQPSSGVYRYSSSTSSSPGVITVISMKDILIEDYQFLRITTQSSDPGCLTAEKISDVPPVFSSDTWLSIWSIQISPDCAVGDYVVIFKLWHGRDLRGQTSIIVKVDG